MLFDNIHRLKRVKLIQMMRALITHLQTWKNYDKETVHVSVLISHIWIFSVRGYTGNCALPLYQKHRIRGSYYIGCVRSRPCSYRFWHFFFWKKAIFLLKRSIFYEKNWFNALVHIISLHYTIQKLSDPAESNCQVP